MQRTMLVAGVILVGGGAIGVYAYQRNQDGQRIIEEKAEAARIYHFGKVEVTGGRIANKGDEIVFTRTLSGDIESYTITQPITWPGDPNSFNPALLQISALAFHNVTQENATAADLAKYGLNPPSLEVELSLAKGETVALYVGAKNEMNASYYVTNHEKKTIWAVPDSFHEFVARELFAFRNKRILSYERHQIDKVSVQKDGAPLYIMQKTKPGESGEDDEWKVGKTELSHRADPVLTNKLLTLLTRDLKADAILSDQFNGDDEAERRAHGLLPPRMTLEVTGNDGSARVVEIGVVEGEAKEGEDEDHEGHEEHEDEAGKKTVYAFVRGTKTLAEVYVTLPEDLDHSVESIRDRTVARFEDTSVQRLELVLWDGAGVEIEQKGKDWAFKKPANGRLAKPWVIEKIIKMMGRLRADSVYKDGPSKKELAAWHLDPPQRRMAFYDASGDLLADIRIGKGLDDKRTFIKNAAKDRVDLIKEMRIKGLPVSIDDLLAD